MPYRALSLLLVVALAVGCQKEKPYPSRSITVICPWGAGGGTDRISRYFANALQTEFANPVVVVNKTGGSGATGHSFGAKARPDGHTITMITAELSTMHQLDITSLTYKDFRPILQMNADPAAIIVARKAPWPDITSFLDAVRNSPGSLKMSGTASGGTWDLARVGMLQAAGLDRKALIWVPTDGAAESLKELLGGHLDAVCCSVPEAAQQIDDGQLKVLAVMSKVRSVDYPQYPTLIESDIPWSSVGWRGLAVPAGTPDDIVETLTIKCQFIAESMEFRTYMQKEGFGVTVRRSKDFLVFLEEQDELWKPVVAAFSQDK
jgi:tripartite-type tricarboxylate transporter receptor subunit TctC